MRSLIHHSIDLAFSLALAFQKPFFRVSWYKAYLILLLMRDLVHALYRPKSSFGLGLRS